MSTPFSAVVSYHLNPYTCGVARWNQALAKRLGVACVGIEYESEFGLHPLFSLKWSELPPTGDQLVCLGLMSDVRRRGGRVSVLWHDDGDERVRDYATQIWWAFRDGLWCPPAPLPSPSWSAMRVFAYGMGHKLQTEPYRKVDALIAATQKTYDLRVSVGIHEGTDLGDVSQRFEVLRSVVGRYGELKVLGSLADHALAEELAEAHAVCAFFPDGIRTNNTSVWTAMREGCPVITNLDARSPHDLIHGVTCFDIAQLSMWPTVHQLRAVGAAGQSLVRDLYGDWDLFVRTLCA